MVSAFFAIQSHIRWKYRVDIVYQRLDQQLFLWNYARSFYMRPNSRHAFPQETKLPQFALGFDFLSNSLAFTSETTYFLHASIERIHFEKVHETILTSNFSFVSKTWFSQYANKGEIDGYYRLPTSFPSKNPIFKCSVNVVTDDFIYLEAKIFPYG